MKQDVKILVIDADKELQATLPKQLSSCGYNHQISFSASNDDSCNAHTGLVFVCMERTTKDYVGSVGSYIHRFATVPLIFIIPAAMEQNLLGLNIDAYLIKGNYTASELAKTIRHAEKETRLTLAIEIAEQDAAKHLSASQQLKKTLRSISDNTNDALLSVDKNGNIVSANRQFQLMMEDTEPTTGGNLWEKYPQLLTMTFYSKLSAAISHDETICFEESLFSKEQSFAIKMVSTGSNINIFFKDITAEKNLARKINEQNKQLSDIAWIQSHKVRSPLVNIIGLLNLVDSATLTDHENKFILEGILKSADELDTITREINAKTQRRETGRATNKVVYSSFLTKNSGLW